MLEISQKLGGIREKEFAHKCQKRLHMQLDSQKHLTNNHFSISYYIFPDYSTGCSRRAIVEYNRAGMKKMQWRHVEKQENHHWHHRTCTGTHIEFKLMA
jgi:hypothetical protein